MNRLIFKLGVILALLMALPVQAQTKLKFSVASFEEDPTDLSAQSAEYRKMDGSGSLYAIIKVTSNNPDDDLREYRFNFGNLKSSVEDHDGELWVYVQMNAKTVTITREGYEPVRRYDLRTNIKPGKNYVMQLTSARRTVYKQMVKFAVTPPDCNAVVMVKATKDDAVEEMFGIVDGSTGEVAKSLELGSYTYRVIAENYYENNGRIILDDRNALLTEKIALRPNFASVTLSVDADAEIYVNNELKGSRTWTGNLKSGNYQVECRQKNHKPGQPQYFTVKDNEPLALTLTPPTPIVGTLSVTSLPLDARISVDGVDFGPTPRIFDIIIGSHTVNVEKHGYQPFSTRVEVAENQTVDVSATLVKNKTGQSKNDPLPKNNDKQNSLMKHNSVYLQVGGQVGTLMGIGANIGAYFRNFNAEASFTKGLVGEPYSELKPRSFGVRFGYGIMVGNRMRLTPQVGVSAVAIDEMHEDGASRALCVTVGVRAEYAISSHFGLSATCEGCLAVNKEMFFEYMSNQTSKVNGWATGGNLLLGIYVSF